MEEALGLRKIVIYPTASLAQPVARIFISRKPVPTEMQYRPDQVQQIFKFALEMTRIQIPCDDPFGEKRGDEDQLARLVNPPAPQGVSADIYCEGDNISIQRPLLVPGDRGPYSLGEEDDAFLFFCGKYWLDEARRLLFRTLSGIAVSFQLPFSDGT